jgi:hypothetical protein
MIPIRRCVLGGLGKRTLNADVCICHGLSRFATVSAGFQFCRSQPVCHSLSSNYVSDRLYSDNWTSPLEEIGPGLIKVTHYTVTHH